MSAHISVIIAVTFSIFSSACTNLSSTIRHTETVRKPNIVLINMDDLGFGDLGSFGHPSINTPNLDELAAKGQKWTNFYAAASVCSPSRAGLMTGRYPVRSGMSGSPSGGPRVFFPFSRGGIPSSEYTLAEMLKDRGYVTAAIGKWHLGHLAEHMPTRHGFDEFFGVPFSNDMSTLISDVGYRKLMLQTNLPEDGWDVPLLQNEREVERPVVQTSLTQRFTEEAVDFIHRQKQDPFFLYLAHSMPHVPLFRSEGFVGRSKGGIYGDVVEEIDWSVGEIITALENSGLAKDTLVIFTSDNGPWLWMNQHGGSSGLLKDGKGTTWEGGVRVPTLFYWPGTIAPAIIQEIGSALDFTATFARLSGAALEDGVTRDSFDLSPTLLGSASAGPIRDSFFYYRSSEVYAARLGAYKAHFITETAYIDDTERTVHAMPLLYNLDVDPAERLNVAQQNPGVLDEIIRLVDAHRATVEKAENQLDLYDARDLARYFGQPSPTEN